MVRRLISLLIFSQRLAMKICVVWILDIGHVFNLRRLGSKRTTASSHTQLLRSLLLLILVLFSPLSASPPRTTPTSLENISHIPFALADHYHRRTHNGC